MTNWKGTIILPTSSRMVAGPPTRATNFHDGSALAFGIGARFAVGANLSDSGAVDERLRRGICRGQFRRQFLQLMKAGV